MANTLLKLRPLVRCLNSLSLKTTHKQLKLQQSSLMISTPKSWISSSPRFFSSDSFAEAQNSVKTLLEEPDNDVKLKLYALFKQGSIGKCNAPKPGALDFVGKAKWNAWNSLGDMKQDEAQKEYVSVVSNLVKADSAQRNAQSKESAAAPTDSKVYEGLKVTNENGALTILLNRPQKKNAITSEMYIGLTELLNDSANDDKIKFIVLRGAGDYFCSGNDLGNFMKMAAGDSDLSVMAKKAAILLKNYVESYINFPKPILAAVNGPAVGIAVTVLGLCDIVYANETATFHTPFSALGQSPEGCSTYTFPKIMGYAKANELLMLNRRISAVEARDWGLISEIIPNANFNAEIDKRVQAMAKLPQLSMAYAKQLTREAEKDILEEVNEKECVQIVERWQSEDCKKALMAFFQKGNQSKM